jgi:hypothetical protein
MTRISHLGRLTCLLLFCTKKSFLQFTNSGDDTDLLHLKNIFFQEEYGPANGAMRSYWNCNSREIWTFIAYLYYIYKLFSYSTNKNLKNLIFLLFILFKIIYKILILILILFFFKFFIYNFNPYSFNKLKNKN